MTLNKLLLLHILYGGFKGFSNMKKVSIVMKFYRIERYLYIHNMKMCAIFIWRLIYILFNCSIPPTTVLEKDVNIAHGIGIVIHQNSIIGEGTYIYQNVTIGSGNGPKIGKNCLLGAGCCILGDINLGDNVKVGANAVVIKDVPENCTVVGVPARIINNRERL